MRMRMRDFTMTTEVRRVVVRRDPDRVPGASLQIFLFPKYTYVSNAIYLY